MESFKFFKEYFGGKKNRFWSTIIKKSLFPIDSTIQKEEVLKNLYETISSGSYQPDPPREYVVINKRNSVARLIPVFQPKDYCLYFYCIKKLEDKMAIDRVENTYGGWSLGGAIRRSEKEEITHILNSFHEYEMPDGSIIQMDESMPYSVESSFNPEAWRLNWNQFTESLYAHSRTGRYTHVAELDIANFYDNIRFDILESKLKATIEDEQKEVLFLLLHFLKCWNDGFNSCQQRMSGIPQDEVGDCSRIVANFYLQEYDQEAYNLCSNYGAKYFRYADDQFIFSSNKEELEEIVCKLSIEALKYGLCTNHKKTKIMNRIDFEDSFSFDWFIKMGNNPSDSEIKKSIEKYFKKKEKLRNSGVSILLRILSFISEETNSELLSHLKKEIINPEFLSSPKLSSWQLEKLFKCLNDDKKNQMIFDLDLLSDKLIHNHFHLVLLKFYESIGKETEIVTNRIDNLKNFYNIYRE